MPETRERLRYDGLSEEEQKDYKRMMENLKYQCSMIEIDHFNGASKAARKGISRLPAMQSKWAWICKLSAS